MVGYMFLYFLLPSQCLNYTKLKPPSNLVLDNMIYFKNLFKNILLYIIIVYYISFQFVLIYIML